MRKEFDKLPVGTNNAYSVNKQGRRFLTDEAKLWKNEIGYAFKKCKPSEKEFGVEIYLTFGDKRKRDADSGLKFILDSLTGVMWIDDSQVREIFIYR